MKIRNGFVSNSSTTSFVLFASKEVFDATLKKLTAREKKIVDEFIQSDTQSFLGKKIMAYSYRDAGDSYEDFFQNLFEEEEDDKEMDEDKEASDEEIDNDDEGDYIRAFAFGGFQDKITKVAKKMGETVLVHSENW